MPYEILWEARGVVKRHHGFLSADELLAASREIQGDPRFDYLRYIINDFLDVEGHAIDRAAIEYFACLRIGAAQINRQVLSPFVATREPGLTIGTLLQAPLYENGHPVRIFPTLTEARAWVSSHPAHWWSY